MTEGSLLFKYLGAPIFRGVPKLIYFSKIVDQMCAKLVGWKGSLLTMADRTQLVKSIIQGMLVYTLMIYAWPKNLLHKLQMSIINFIWTGYLQI